MTVNAFRVKLDNGLVLDVSHQEYTGGDMILVEKFDENHEVHARSELTPEEFNELLFSDE